MDCSRAKMPSRKDRKADKMINQRNRIMKSALLHVDGTTLFYPCSGNDWRVPIKMFVPYITDFWFVDKGYFNPGSGDTRSYGFDKPAYAVPPLLNSNPDFKFLWSTIKGVASWDGYPELEPCLLTEYYKHKPSKREITVRRRRGYGFSAFRRDITSIGVFFYRGDSPAEGGSGNLWMTPGHINEICDKLIDGGLIVTDGSQHNKSRQYEAMWRHSEPYEDIIKSSQPFTDKVGRQFTCVGYAGQRYGPTRVWEVSKVGAVD